MVIKRAKSSLFTNFSILSLALMFSLGMFFAIISYTLEPLSRLLKQNKHKDGYALVEWHANETLQLHRLVNEGYGYGNWSNCRGGIPVTERGDTLGILDLQHIDHPILQTRSFPGLMQQFLFAAGRLKDFNE